MSFKVPIGYREITDTRNTEVVYDDATTWSWVDSSGGGDEGDNVMFVFMDSEYNLDKSFKEIVDALNSEKSVVLLYGGDNDLNLDYLVETKEDDGNFLVYFLKADFITQQVIVKEFLSNTETGVLTLQPLG